MNIFKSGKSESLSVLATATFLCLGLVSSADEVESSLVVPNESKAKAEELLESKAVVSMELTIKEELYKNLVNSVNGLAVPARWEDAVRVPIDVTTEDKEARYFTRQGFGLLQNQWDIESHRSFIHALRFDKDCIGPYIGLLMLSTQRHNPSFLYQKSLASVVMSLKNERKDDGYVYSLQERLYAEVALSMSDGIQDDLVESVNELVKAYPMDFQALIMQQVILPMRVGGNSVNDKSKFIGRMMKRYPMVPMLWVYWLSIHQFQNDSQFLKNEVIPYSAKLVKWAPKMPVWYLYHGMFLHKSEQYDAANENFDKAIELYAKWGVDSNVPKDVNAPLWQALIFKSVNYYKAGKFDEAMKLAKDLQGSEVNVNLRSEVRGIYLWEVQSLPARLYIARNEPGDLIRARESLPAKELLNAVEEISAAPMYYTTLNEYIAFKIAIKEGNIDAAKEIKLSLLDKSRQNFDLTKVKSNNFIDRNYFHRGRYAVYVYQNFANAELEKVAGNMKGYETFREYLNDALNRGSRILILPRHVIEKF